MIFLAEVFQECSEEVVMADEDIFFLSESIILLIASVKETSSLGSTIIPASPMTLGKGSIFVVIIGNPQAIYSYIFKGERPILAFRSAGNGATPTWCFLNVDGISVYGIYPSIFTLSSNYIH